MEVFKYCTKQNMDSMLLHGQIRIGTLFDWRRSHQYGELVGDQDEGYTRIGGNVLWYDHRFVGAILVESTVVDNSTPGNHNVHFTNHAFHTPNVFTLSVSTTYSEHDHRLWLEKEGYDACYRIRSARLFFKAISRSPDFAPMAAFVCQGPIHYYDKSQPNHQFLGTFHPALVKRPEFGSQSEIRAIWAPRTADQDIAPIVLNRTEASKYCCVHRLL